MTDHFNSKISIFYRYWKWSGQEMMRSMQELAEKKLIKTIDKNKNVDKILFNYHISISSISKVSSTRSFSSAISFEL